MYSQTTTISSQGKNAGYGRAYVAPVTTKTYTTPSTPNKTYTPPSKTYTPSSSGSNNSTYTPSRSSGTTTTSSGYSSGYIPPPVEGYRTQDLTTDDIAIRKAIEAENWDKVFEMADNPKSDFNYKATAGGGLVNAGYPLIYKLEQHAKKNTAYLPLIYKTTYVYHMSFNIPVFKVLLEDLVYTDIRDASPFIMTDACIYVGNYNQAIINYKTHQFFGQKKPWAKKKNKEYAEQEKARNYINYMAGRCYEMLGMTEEAQKALSLTNVSFEERWNQLFTDGATERAAQTLYKPGQETNVWKERHD